MRKLILTAAEHELVCRGRAEGKPYRWIAAHFPRPVSPHIPRQYAMENGIEKPRTERFTQVQEQWLKGALADCVPKKKLRADFQRRFKRRLTRWALWRFQRELRGEPVWCEATRAKWKQRDQRKKPRPTFGANPAAGDGVTSARRGRSQGTVQQIDKAAPGWLERQARYAKCSSWPRRRNQWRRWDVGKHTPGPWEIDAYSDSGTTAISAEAREAICIIQHDEERPCDEEEGQANARLIAAAPDLLAACKEAVTYCELNRCGVKLKPMLLAAIRKATEPTP